MSAWGQLRTGPRRFQDCSTVSALAAAPSPLGPTSMIQSAILGWRFLKRRQAGSLDARANPDAPARRE
jgi:hypothetical protein